MKRKGREAARNALIMGNVISHLHTFFFFFLRGNTYIINLIKIEQFAIIKQYHKYRKESFTSKFD
jgi:hypothetical protein